MILNNKYTSVVVYNNACYLVKYSSIVLYGIEYVVNEIFDFIPDLTRKDLKELCDDIEYIIKITDEEVEYIQSYMNAFVKNLRFKPERNNVVLDKLCESVCNVYGVYLNEYGLLQINWQELGFWQFIACRELQAAAIEKSNSEIQKRKL